jgi:hypothetical protein
MTAAVGPPFQLWTAEQRERPGPVLFTLDVDGEWFAICRAGGGGTAYDWLSGPHKGYGFGSSGPPNRPVEEQGRGRSGLHGTSAASPSSRRYGSL